MNFVRDLFPHLLRLKLDGRANSSRRINKRELLKTAGLAGAATTMGSLISAPRIQAAALSDHAVTPQKYGAFGDGINDDTAAFQDASDYSTRHGVPLFVPPGSYRLTATVTHDLTHFTHESDETGSPILGAGAGITEIIVDHPDSGIRVVGDNTVGSGGHGHTAVSHLKFRGSLAETGIGLLIDTVAFMQCEDLFFYSLADGVVLQDALSSRFYNVRARWCTRGITGEARSRFSNPNSLTFYGTHLGNCAEHGIRMNRGAQFSMFGGSVERCGLNKSKGAEGGIVLSNSGVAGGIGCNLSGIYFEANKGVADVIIVHGRSQCLYNLTGCNFNRIDRSAHTIRNVYLTAKDGDARAVLSVTGCAFTSYNNYASDRSRPYIQISDEGGLVDFEDGGNLYEDALEWPTRRGYHTYAGCVFDGTSRRPQLDQAKFVRSLIKNSTGDFTLGFREDLPAHRSISISLNGPGVGYVWGETSSGVRIRTTNMHGKPEDFSRIHVTISI